MNANVELGRKCNTRTLRLGRRDDQWLTSPADWITRVDLSLLTLFPLETQLQTFR
jgi:hypothetical protein